MIDIIYGTWQEHLTGPIQALITDPPYNTTGCAWDGAFNPEEFWHHIGPKLAPQHTVIFTAQMRLAVDLIRYAKTKFRHDLVWEKPNGTGQVKNRPHRCHELVLVFGNGPYYPQMQQGKPYTWRSKRSKGEATGYADNSGEIQNTGTRHPRSVLHIAQQRGLHPTQKPVELMKFLIESYTEPNWHIWEPFGGSGTTGVAAKELGRTATLIEQNADYIEIIKERLV